MAKVFIVSYSRTGNTERMAQGGAEGCGLTVPLGTVFHAKA